MPRVPHDNNPVGCYRTSLYRCPTAWDGRPVSLVFDGVDSAFYLWVNGQEVGYSQDSRLPAEFDITPYLQAGREPAGRCGSIAGRTAATWRTRTTGG